MKPVDKIEQKKMSESEMYELAELMELQNYKEIELRFILKYIGLYNEKYKTNYELVEEKIKLK